MSTHTIIAIAVVSTLGLGIIIHSWLHKIIKFKMDESSIVQHFRENTPSESVTLETLATSAALPEKRTLEVCQKSTQLSPEESGLWKLNG